MGPIPFRFNPLWSGKEGFMEIVMEAWSIPVIGSPNFVWEQKLKITKRALKKWIKEPSNSPTSNRKEIVQFLSNLQMDLESKEISASDLEKEQATQNK